MDKKYFLYLHDCKFEVSKKDYVDYWKMMRRQKYLREMDEARELVSYNAMDSCKFSGEEYLVDTGESVEDKAIKNILLGKLKACLDKLTGEEKRFILLVFSGEHTQSNMGRQLGMSQQAISKRKEKIIRKLRKDMNP